MKIFNKNLNRNLYNYELDAIPLYDFDKWIGIELYETGEITLDEMIVLSELPMMYNSRYDERILTNYYKAIEGYKNWKDFSNRTQMFYLRSVHNIDKVQVLSNLLRRVLSDLLDYNKSVSNLRNYIELSGLLIVILRLFHLKGYDKSIVYDILTDLNLNEADRLSFILRSTKIWNYGFLGRLIQEDLTERLYCMSIGCNPWSFMNCNSDSFLIPENDDDNNLIIKWNTLKLSDVFKL